MTANNQIKYSDQLNNLVQQAHKYNCDANKWSYTTLYHGTYGWDNLAICIDDYIKLENKKELNTNQVAKLVHKSWIKSYTYWRDNEPFNVNPIYKKPYKQLNDEYRNNCAILPYAELDKDTQEKDIIIAQFLLKNIEINND